MDFAHPLAAGLDETATSPIGHESAMDTAGDDAKILARIGRNPGMLDRAARRLQVLTKYTVKEDSPAMSSLLGSAGEEAELSEADRNRMKLSRLMVLTAGETSLHGAQIELISIIERMDAELKRLWAEGDRVRALRITIQAIKLLGHTKVPQCYPSVFMLAATVLDTFGDLVADRLRESAASQSPLIKQLLEQGKEPDPAIIPPQTVEMCNNWFLKILSIRELLPRVYVELSLMRTYRYVAKKFRIDSMREVVERLAMQVRGVADPIVAAHARWYVCLRAKEVLSHDHEHWGEAMVVCAEDTLQLIANLPPAAYECKGLTRSAYVLLFMPSLQWLIDTIAKHSNRDVAEQFLERVLKMMESNPSLCHSSIAQILTAAFDAPLVVERVHRFMALLANTELTMTFDVPRLNVIASLCHALAETAPPLPYSKHDKMALINHLWEIVNADRGNLEGFLVASRGLLRLLAVHASGSQVRVLVGAITSRIDEGASPRSPTAEDATLALPHVDLAHLCQDLLLTLVTHVPGSTVFAMWAQVLPLMHHVSASDRDAFVRRLLKAAPHTARFSATVLDLCRQLHDRLDDDTAAADVSATSASVCRAIRNCFSAEDVEAQLRFLGDCRHGLSQLDAVKVTTCEEALRLVRVIHDPAPGKKVKRTAAKACFAFCHVTAPGINDAGVRLQTCANAASVAFHLGHVGQAEALLMYAIGGLKDLLPREKRRDGTIRNNDAAIVRIAVNLLSLSAAAPAHAKYGALYGMVAIVDWANEFQWGDASDGAWRVACAALRLAGKVAKGKLPFGFAKCPKPATLRDDETFDNALTTVIINACNVVTRDISTSGHAVLAGIESTLTLYRANPRTGRLLQRCMRLALSGSCAGESTDIVYQRHKVVVLGAAREALGTEDRWNNLIDGDDIPPLQAGQSDAAAAEDEVAAS